MDAAKEINLSNSNWPIERKLDSLSFLAHQKQNEEGERRREGRGGEQQQHTFMSWGKTKIKQNRRKNWWNFHLSFFCHYQRTFNVVGGKKRKKKGKRRKSTTKYREPDFCWIVWTLMMFFVCSFLSVMLWWGREKREKKRGEEKGGGRGNSGCYFKNLYYLTGLWSNSPVWTPTVKSHVRGIPWSSGEKRKKKRGKKEKGGGDREKVGRDKRFWVIDYENQCNFKHVKWNQQWKEPI